MSKWDAYKASKWGAYAQPSTAQFSTPAIESEIARRETPTRLEQFTDQAIGADKRALLDKLMGMFSPTMGFGPKPSRAAGELVDMAVDIPSGVAQVVKSGVSNPQQIPAGLLQAIKGMGTSMATTARYPGRSFMGRPFQAAGDVYAGTQIAKAGIKAAKALTPTPTLNPIQKETFYTLGKRAQEGINKLRKDYGAAVGAEKEAAKMMKARIDTTPMVAKTERAIAEAGAETFDPSDLRAIKMVEKKLLSMGAKPDAKTLMATKDMINNRFLTYGKPGQVVQTKITGYGEKLLRQMRDDIDAQLRFHDLKPELGGTGGSWAKANDDFHKVANLHENAAKLIGNDFNLERQMTKIGQEMVDGNPAYNELFKSIDDLLPQNSKFARQLEESVIGLRAVKALQKVPVVGGLIRGGTAAKAIGQLGLRKGARLASSIGGAIESVPAPWELGR